MSWVVRNPSDPHPELIHIRFGDPISINSKTYDILQTLNIGCCGSCPISTMTWRVSEERQSRVWIGGRGVWRGLRATFGGGGGLGAIFRGVLDEGLVWGLLKVFLPKACVQQSLCRRSLGQSFEATAIGSVTRGKLNKYEKECDVWMWLSPVTAWR